MPLLIVIVLLIFIAVGIGAGIYFYDLVISTKGGKNKAKVRNPEAEDEQDVHYDHGYFDTAEKEDVYMQSRDGLMLHGIVIENDPSKWAVLCHGYTGSAYQMSSFGEIFAEKGFSILAVDLRGHGSSEGAYRGMGWHDSFDVCDWAALIEERYKVRDIALFGISMGGATVMMASGHKLPANVKVIIEDCGYSSIKAELKYNAKKSYHLPSFPLMNFLSGVTKIKAGYSILNDGDAVAQVRQTDIPILFIHGEEDRFVPFSMMNKLYKAAGGPKMKFTVPGAAHGKSFAMDPEGYKDAVYSFLYKYIRI